MWKSPSSKNSGNEEKERFKRATTWRKELEKRKQNTKSMGPQKLSVLIYNLI